MLENTGSHTTCSSLSQVWRICMHRHQSYDMILQIQGGHGAAKTVNEGELSQGSLY